MENQMKHRVLLSASLIETGSNVYAFLGDNQQNFYLASFKIESNGELEYLGKTSANAGVSQLRFVQYTAIGIRLKRIPIFCVEPSST
jgi:hypothetical protein